MKRPGAMAFLQAVSKLPCWFLSSTFEAIFEMAFNDLKRIQSMRGPAINKNAVFCDSVLIDC
jgi:hypothetical protein